MIRNWVDLETNPWDDTRAIECEICAALCATAEAAERHAVWHARVGSPSATEASEAGKVSAECIECAHPSDGLVDSDGCGPLCKACHAERMAPTAAQVIAGAKKALEKVADREAYPNHRYRGQSASDSDLASELDKDLDHLAGIADSELAAIAAWEAAQR